MPYTTFCPKCGEPEYLYAIVTAQVEVEIGEDAGLRYEGIDSLPAEPDSDDPIKCHNCDWEGHWPQLHHLPQLAIQNIMKELHIIHAELVNRHGNNALHDQLRRRLNKLQDAIDTLYHRLDSGRGG